MEDVQEPGKGGDAGPSRHSGESHTLVRFSGFVLDLDACRLERENGEIVALTRGEYSLLRFFVSRSGRVVSRETLLNEVSNRRFDPFDRSVDAAVRRLRRKIEPNPSRPHLIVTVAGEGYRFDGRTSPFVRVLKVEGQELQTPLNVTSTIPSPAERPERPRVKWPESFRNLYFLATLILLTLLGGSWLYLRAPRRAPDAPPIIIVLPFENLSGDPGKDYLGRSLSIEVATLLSAYPGLKVVAQADFSHSASDADAPWATQSVGGRYGLWGAVHQLRDSVRVTASLYDVGTRAALWSQVFDDGNDALASQEEIPRQIYDSLAGFRGAIQRSEERIAWQRPSSSLNDYDFYLRAASLYFRSDLSDVLKARSVLQEGLDRYPDSVLLRLTLAWTHLWVAMNEPNDDPGPDIDKAWRLANEASSAPSHSPFEAWLEHWLMAFLFQWRNNDFSRSVMEAHNAVALAPYDAFSRSDLSWILANAGHAEEAIGWARFALQHDPNGPSRYHANLAWAYFVAGREREGIHALREKSGEFPILSAALHIRLGEVEEAQALVAQYIQAGGADTVHREDIVPLIEPAGTEYVETLRKAGMPEK
jgi:TolB-like protein/DNA-binding winged helix-turn-helix (wHTH) protein